MVDDILAVTNCSPQSTQVNNVVNTFMELEKLKLSETKCHKLHIGGERRTCPDLKVHGRTLGESSVETYLGDKLHNSGKNQTNLDSRLAKGHGKVRTIMAIIKDTPLGWWRIKAGLRLRNAMLINGMLFNSESWHGITLKDIEKFEKIDDSLLRALTDSHSKIPIPALYMDLGVVPLRFILAARRILYLHTILTRDLSEITKKIYLAQQQDPLEGDFYKLVMNDIEMIELKMNEDDISKVTKASLMKRVKVKYKEAAYKYLTTQKASKRKMDHMKYTHLETQPYMCSPIFLREDSSMLLRLRTRTVRGIRTDFGDMYIEKSCPLTGCTETYDSLPHVLVCSALQTKQNEIQDMHYMDVFSDNVHVQKSITATFTRLLQRREDLLESTPDASTSGPMH